MNGITAPIGILGLQCAREARQSRKEFAGRPLIQRQPQVRRAPALVDVVTSSGGTAFQPSPSANTVVKGIETFTHRQATESTSTPPDPRFSAQITRHGQRWSMICQMQRRTTYISSFIDGKYKRVTRAWHTEIAILLEPAYSAALTRRPESNHVMDQLMGQVWVISAL